MAPAHLHVDFLSLPAGKVIVKLLVILSESSVAPAHLHVFSPHLQSVFVVFLFKLLVILSESSVAPAHLHVVFPTHLQARRPWGDHPSVPWNQDQIPGHSEGREELQKVHSGREWAGPGVLVFKYHKERQRPALVTALVVGAEKTHTRRVRPASVWQGCWCSGIWRGRWWAVVTAVVLLSTVTIVITTKKKSYAASHLSRKACTHAQSHTHACKWASRQLNRWALD